MHDGLIPARANDGNIGKERFVPCLIPTGLSRPGPMTGISERKGVVPWLNPTEKGGGNVCISLLRSARSI